MLKYVADMPGTSISFFCAFDTSILVESSWKQSLGLRSNGKVKLNATSVCIILLDAVDPFGGCDTVVALISILCVHMGRKWWVVWREVMSFAMLESREEEADLRSQNWLPEQRWARRNSGGIENIQSKKAMAIACKIEPRSSPNRKFLGSSRDNRVKIYRVLRNFHMDQIDGQSAAISVFGLPHLTRVNHLNWIFTKLL